MNPPSPHEGRFRLAGLGVTDIDEERSTVTVRLGKGRKDRTVPIGQRAIDWIARYLDEVRPQLVIEPDDGVLFLNEHGMPLDLGYVTNLMKSYVDGAKLGKTGACHIFRHTMATLMLEGGADVRHIQEILGHVEASTTAIYTRVSIKHLVEVHRRCHPGARVVEPKKEPEAEEAKEKLLEQLDEEDDEDG